MDWDLWTSSFDQVFYDDNNSEWQCDCFGWGRDAIEEDALNEESCVQVLRILITKADTEIEELEKDLLLLQNELAWAENENWPEICCNALDERISKLEAAVSLLKSDQADEEIQLLLHSKPAETVNEIVEALKRDHCHDTHGQHLDANIPNPIVNVTEHALGNVSSSIDSSGITNEAGNEHYGTSENPPSSEPRLELHEKISDDPEKTEELLAVSLVRSPDLGALSCVPDHSNGMSLSDTLVDNVREQIQLSTTDTDQILDPFSSMGNGHISSEAKEENTTVKESVCPDGYRFAVGIMGRKMYHSRFGTAQQESGNSDLDRKLCDFASKTARRARRRESKVAPDEDLESMNKPLQVVYPQKWCFSDTAFKGTNGIDSLQAINIEKDTSINDENSALISLPAIQTKNTLCTGLRLTDEEKPQVQDPKFDIAAKFSKSNMRFPPRPKAQGKKKPELDACSSRELLDSPMEVIPSTSKNISTKRLRKSKTCMARVILNEPINRKITKKALQPGHHEIECHAIVPYDSNFSAKGLLDSPTEVIPIASEIVSTKKKRKSKTCRSSVILNKSMNRKNTKTAEQPGQHETEGHAIVLYDSDFSELQKKSRASMLPITSNIQNSTVNLDITSSDRVTEDNGSQHNSKSCSLADFHNESSALLPVMMTNLKMIDTLNKKKMPDLREMAREYKIKQYYKLTKGALVAQLAEQLNRC